MVRLKLKYAKLEVGGNKAQVDKYSFKLYQTLENLLQEKYPVIKNGQSDSALYLQVADTLEEKR